VTRLKSLVKNTSKSFRTRHQAIKAIFYTVTRQNII